MKKLIIIALFISGAVLLSFSCSLEQAISPDKDINEYFDCAYDIYLGQSKLYKDKQGTKVVQIGDPVMRIDDFIGNKHLFYNGDTSKLPALTQLLGENFLTLPFWPNIKWQSEVFDPIPQPYHVFLVGRDLQTANRDAYSYSAMSIQMKPIGDHMRIGVGIDYSDFPSGTGVPEENKVFILEVSYNEKKSKVWINNFGIPGVIDAGTREITAMNLGTIANSANWDFFALYMKFGTLEESERTFIYEKLSKLYKTNKYPSAPIANNIKVKETETDLYLSYDFYNELGISEGNPNDHKYRWYYCRPGNTPKIDAELPLPGQNSQFKTLTKSDYPELLVKGAWVFCYIQVFDEEGNTWRYLHSDWAMIQK